MLGAENSAKGNSIYVKTTSSNKLTFEVPYPIEGSYDYKLTMGTREGKVVQRVTPKNGINGFLTGATIEDNPYNPGKKDLNLKIRAIGGGKHQDYVITLSMSSAAVKQIAKGLPNVDPNAPISIVGYDSDQLNAKGNPWGAFYFKQGDSFVNAAYTKKNPNGMPLPTLYKDPADGKEKTSYLEQMDFLAEVLEGLTYHIPAGDTEQYEMKPLGGVVAPVAAPVSPEPVQEMEMEDDEDLPF